MKTTVWPFAIALSLLTASVDAKTIVVLMDGTWNEPEFEENGKFPQGDATNVEKLRRLLLGQGQSIHYFRGIGTDGKQIRKVVDGAFGTTAEKRVDEAMQKLTDAFETGDDIVVFGFSRGAATCRILARRIRAKGVKGQHPTIRFMGLWDTVASLGVPVPKLSEFRKKFHDAEERLRIPDNVNHVVHLAAIDEDRSLFALTRVSLDSPQTTVNEVWFAGNHGDVGGGWVKTNPSERQLSDVTLAYMIRSAESCGVKFITNWQTKVLEPINGAGKVHQLTLKDPTRLLGGKLERQLQSAGSGKPRLHHSVKLKYDNDTSYRPAQLERGFARVEIVH
jgi:uncharacterized protein (DUF2235 family)